MNISSKENKREFETADVEKKLLQQISHNINLTLEENGKKTQKTV